MQSIVCINIAVPTIENYIEYNSEDSLRDYDIAVFCPSLPYYSRIDFSGGGSCISIEGMSSFTRASSHWGRELRDALAAGKTVFFVLDKHEEKQAATGYTSSARNNRTYQTTNISSYNPIPINLRVKNARGKVVVVKDAAFKGLYEAIKEAVEYRVVIEAPVPLQTTFAAKDGTAVGGVARVKDLPGSLVLIPYFDFDTEDFTSHSEEENEAIWNQKAIKSSHAFVGQLVAIDRMLRGAVSQVPPPDWVSSVKHPAIADRVDASIAEIDARITELGQQREQEARRRVDLNEYTHLLYESGKALERAIEKVLQLLGYKVETLRIGDLEIDHVIVGPSGIRMIGESEGKDASAIDISKFRQLESNIGEDFEREEIDEPAKGILFGNGYRLTHPESRAEQFTQKSLTNARRLGSALIRTADLYAVALHILDAPEDDAFKSACRAAIEETVGSIVVFPTPPNG